MFVTVFTPTYNRGYIISNLYESLQRQTVNDFEWIVIDDGSIDNTSHLFEKWLNETNSFSIAYEKVENGGKHRAINKGINKAKGELFFIVDSDDYLTDDAIEKIIELEKTIPEERKKEFAGICENKGYPNGKIVGTTFTSDAFLDITMLECEKNGIRGDKAEVFYTEVMRKYPFPEFTGETFIRESVVWYRIAFDGYKLRYDNDIVYICDYLPDGLTVNGEEWYDKNPQGYGLFVFQRAKFGITSGLQKWNEYYSYFFRFKKRFGLMKISNNLHINPFVLYFRILGMRVFYRLYDRDD